MDDNPRSPRTLVPGTDRLEIEYKASHGRLARARVVVQMGCSQLVLWSIFRSEKDLALGKFGEDLRRLLALVWRLTVASPAAPLLHQLQR